MEELSALFRWLFEGKGAFIKLFIGDMQPLTSYSLHLVRSGDLITEKIQRLRDVQVEGNVNMCYDVMLYTDSEHTVMDHFSEWRVLMNNIVIGGILINERFYGEEMRGDGNVKRCASNNCNSTDGLRSIDGNDIKQRMQRVRGDDPKLTRGKNTRTTCQIVEEAQQYFNSYGAFIVCKVKLLALKKYLDRERNSYVLCHRFLKQYERCDINTGILHFEDEKRRRKGSGSTSNKVCKRMSKSKERSTLHNNDRMKAGDVGMDNDLNITGSYGRKTLPRPRRADTQKCTKEQVSNARLIGQFNNEFIIIEIADSIFMIDQHAIHERIRLEKLLKIRKMKGIEYDLEALKESACKGAIKFKEKLSVHKMKEIVRWYRSLKYPFVCCHGRPTIVHVGRVER